jgi:Flp pilus assembly protein TadG
MPSGVPPGHRTHEKAGVISTQMFTLPPRRKPRHRDTRPDTARRQSRRSRGQSLTEFALLVPVMLAFLGLTIDFARVFQVWITLESATRDGAEAAATNGSSSANALTWAQKTICLQAQNIPGFQRSGLASPNDIQQCSSPAVTVVSFGRSSTADGGSDSYPIGSATVRTTVPFNPLFAYPFLTQNGTWTVTSQQSFSIAQGRQ